jgi:hypothetical protein
VEVIPNKLAVISLNTLYWFSSNAAVDGCDHKSEPGSQQFEWLRYESISEFRGLLVGCNYQNIENVVSKPI